MSNLKPCPFCGSKPYLSPGETRYYVKHGSTCRLNDSYNDDVVHVCFAKDDVEGYTGWNDRPIEDALKARIAELEAALDKAAHQLYDYSGSCPSDLYDWEHPNTCIRECDRYDNPDEAWKCWRLWLLEKPKEEK